jgi:hypothetical protein
MRERLELPPVEVNIRLLEVESRLASLLEETAAYPNDAVHEIVNAIEASGCDGYFTSKGDAQSRVKIEVLALDLAWVTPGPYKTWSSKGKQVCFCRHPSGPKRHDDTWYARSLQRYFGAANARSLLTLPFIYSRKSFVRVHWLTKLSPKRVGIKLGRIIKGGSVKVWMDRFDPIAAVSPRASSWSQRFQEYKTLILHELHRALPSYAANDAMLAWVYVGPGTKSDDGSPPPWGASIFLIFRFPIRAADAQRRLKQNVSLLLSNLHNALRNVAPVALGTRGEKQNLTQAWAHEFKNLTQDVAVISQLVRRKSSRNVLTSRRGASDLDEQALHLGIQALNAFCRVAYWLFSPNKGDPVPLIPDNGAQAFYHGLALAIRLIAPSRSGWEYSDLPSFEEILEFFNRTYNLRVRSIDRLVARLPVAFLLFFALEPVSNIEGKAGTVSIRIRRANNRVYLHQTAEERSGVGDTVKSASVEFLMSEVSRYCSAKLIDIDPIVRARTRKRTSSGNFMVERITTFTVHNIHCF